MDSKQIQYILKVAECRNITRAAQQLYMTQPALSHFISKVEEELGARIFNRGLTPLTLTPAGELYVHTAKMMRSLEENLKRDVQSLDQSGERVIRLGLSDMRATCLLPMALPGFRRLYPNILVKTTESTSYLVEENVRGGKVDLGIIPLYDYQDSFSRRVLYEEELVLVSGEELPHQEGVVRPWVDLEELNHLGFIMLNQDSRIRKAVDAIFMEHGLRPRTVAESCNNMTAYMLASAGVAAAIVPEAMLRLLNPVRAPRVYSIGKKGVRWEIGAIWRGDMALTPAQQQFLKLLTTQSM